MLQTQLGRDVLLNLVRQGKPLVILDDRRELEGDLFCAAEVVELEVLQFMVRRCSGFLCLALPFDRLIEIGVPRISGLLSQLNQHYDDLPDYWQRFLLNMLDAPDTPFHFPVDLKGTFSGISVEDRYATIQALLEPGADITQFESPGHLPLLGAHPEGFQGRIGHTESAVELCQMAGLQPAGLLCEIVADDGTMARGEELDRFVQEHSLDVVSITQLVALCSGPGQVLASGGQDVG